MWGKVSFLIFTLSVLIQDPVLVTVSEEILFISPEAPVVKSGEAVELACVSHCPSDRPRWEKTIDLAPGKEILSHSKTLLRIDKVLEAYEADYKCTITCAGKFSSKEVFLTVYSFPHSPKVELQSLNPVSGQTITLQCSARDLYPCHNVNVLWYHNFEVFEIQKAEPIWNSGLTCNVISRVNYKTNTRSRDLTFTCQLRLGLNSVGFREQNSSLELHLYTGLHNIWIEPTHTVKRVGDLLSISCSADGDPLPTITWRKVGSGAWTTQHWNITGAHGRSTLFIHELRAQDGGVYICKISSGANSTDRQSSVEVWYGPRNVSIDGGGSARDSEALALSCRGDANPEPNITWRRTDLSAQRRWNISRSRGESELRIDSLRPDDHGIYECVVENKLGEVRLTAQVDVEYGPRNVSIDGGGSARDSEALALSCRGDANPEPNITWRRTDLSAQRRWNISRSRGESELRIDSLRPDDHGIYECVVENKLGEVRLTAQVDVEYGPRNVSIDGGGSARDSEALALSCRGDANPEPNITWRRTDLSAQRRWNISRSRGESELRIDSLRPDDHGIYECVVENKLGEVRLTAQVDVFVTVKPEQEAVTLGLSVPLASLAGFAVLIYIIRKRLLKHKTIGKASTPGSSISKSPPSPVAQSSP